MTKGAAPRLGCGALRLCEVRQEPTRKRANWVALAPDGSKKTGLQQGCFNGIALREQGAPQEFLDRTPICTPEEIGYFPR